MIKKIVISLSVCTSLSLMANDQVTAKDIRVSLGKTIISQENIKINQELLTDKIDMLSKDISEYKELNNNDLKEQIDKLKKEVNRLELTSFSKEKILRPIDDENLKHIDFTSKQTFQNGETQGIIKSRQNAVKTAKVLSSALNDSLRTNEAVTLVNYTNVREKPITNSKALALLSLCTKVKVSGCEVISANESWCKLDDRVGYIRKDLLSFTEDSLSFKKRYRNTKAISRLNVLGISKDNRWACIADSVLIDTKIINLRKKAVDEINK